MAVVDVVIEGSVVPEARPRLMADLEAALAPLPGVRSVGATFKLPLRGSGQSWGIALEGRPELPNTTTFVRLVTPGANWSVPCVLRYSMPALALRSAVLYSTVTDWRKAVTPRSNSSSALMNGR